MFQQGVFKYTLLIADSNENPSYSFEFFNIKKSLS